MVYLIKVIGATGLILITLGVLTKKRISQTYLFIFGGIFLLAYSIYLKDPIFIPLQIIFTLASLYEIYTLKKK